MWLERWEEHLRFIDALLTAILFWFLFRLLLQRRRSYRVLVGVLMLGLAYLASSALGLELTRDAVLGLLAICAIVATLALQDDVRRGLEALALGKQPPVPDHVREVLVRSCFRMAEQRIGALIVLPGKEPLEGHVSQGIRLDAVITEPLLLSLFDPGSPGHDGAVVVRGDRLECFAVHLPLSRNEAELAGRGTRHASALGISEWTDALCIVVSEETGHVSVSRQGALTPVDEAVLRARLDEHVRRPGEPLRRASRTRLRLAEILLALLAVLALWYAEVPGSVVITRTFEVPIELENLPEALALDQPPLSVQVTLSGPRRALLLVTAAEIEVPLDAWLTSEGKSVFVISRADVRAPLGIEVLDVYPRRVQLELARAP